MIYDENFLEAFLRLKSKSQLLLEGGEYGRFGVVGFAAEGYRSEFQINLKGTCESRSVKHWSVEQARKN